MTVYMFQVNHPFCSKTSDLEVAGFFHCYRLHNLVTVSDVPPKKEIPSFIVIYGEYITYDDIKSGTFFFLFTRHKFPGVPRNPKKRINCDHVISETLISK